MANVRYQLGAGKNYNFENNVLTTVSSTINIAFFSDVAEPVAAGLAPYYKSAEAQSDVFFLSLLAQGFVFSRFATTPNFREQGGSSYCNWSETYVKVPQQLLGDNEYFDVRENISAPTWRLNMVNLVDYVGTETRRLRQAYGYTPLAGSFSARTRKEPSSNFKDWFLGGTDFTKIIVESASKQESFDGNELIYTINVSWKSMDLNIIPRFY